MATDYQISVSLKNKTTNVTTQQTGVTYTGGDFEDSGIWNVGTSEMTHTIDTDIINVAGIYVENLAASNYVELGDATATYQHKIPAGTAWMIPLVPGIATLYVKSNTAASNVQYRIFEAP